MNLIYGWRNKRSTRVSVSIFLLALSILTRQNGGKVSVFRAGPGTRGNSLYHCVSVFYHFSSLRVSRERKGPSLRARVRVRACPRGRVTVSTLIDKVSWQRQQFLVNTGAGLAPQTNDAESHSKRTVCKRCRIPKLNLFSDALFRISAAYRVLAFYAIETVWILF